MIMNPIRTFSTSLLVCGSLVFVAVCSMECDALSAADRWDVDYVPEVSEGMPCRVMQPLGFDSAKSYPVIVSLHGGGGKGTDNNKQLRDWNRQLAETQRR